MNEGSGRRGGVREEEGGKGGGEGKGKGREDEAERGNGEPKHPQAETAATHGGNGLVCGQQPAEFEPRELVIYLESTL